MTKYYVEDCCDNKVYFSNIFLECVPSFSFSPQTFEMNVVASGSLMEKKEGCCNSEIHFSVSTLHFNLKIDILIVNLHVGGPDHSSIPCLILILPLSLVYRLILRMSQKYRLIFT